MKRWENNVRKVVPYTPGEQPKKRDMVKLNTNENPYPPAPGVQEVLKNLDADELKLYPDPLCEELNQELADYYHVSKEQVFSGVGSDDVLAMAFLTFFNSIHPILFPDITYSFYDVWADLFKIPYKKVKLDENFKINKKDYFVRNGGIVLPNPNAPTGVFEDLQNIEEIIRRNKDVIVIIDEAYVDFGGESVMKLIDKYDNLLVVQTFSKSRSLAGMRIGYAIGNPLLIRYLNDVKYSFNSYTMNTTALKLGVAALKDEAYFQETIKKTIEVREWTKKQLRELAFEFQDSQANFVFASHKTVNARDIFEALKLENIYVRYFNLPRIDNHLRISIGTQEEMEKLIAFLKRYLNKELKENE